MQREATPASAVCHVQPTTGPNTYMPRPAKPEQSLEGSQGSLSRRIDGVPGDSVSPAIAIELHATEPPLRTELRKPRAAHMFSGTPRIADMSPALLVFLVMRPRALAGDRGEEPRSNG